MLNSNAIILLLTNHDQKIIHEYFVVILSKPRLLSHSVFSTCKKYNFNYAKLILFC